MDFGLTGKLEEYYLAQQYQKNGAVGKGGGVIFAELATAKSAEQSNVSGMSFKDMWKARFPGAYYNVMDTSRIDGSLWERKSYQYIKKLGMKFTDDVMQYNHIDWTEWTVK